MSESIMAKRWWTHCDDLGYRQSWSRIWSGVVAGVDGESESISPWQKYSNEEAAIKLHGTAKKKTLNSSSFVIEFEHGANNKGYWQYDHMVTQVEDCRDILKVMMQDWDQYCEVHFMLDHSQNHNKHKPDGLNDNQTNAGSGWEQPKCTAQSSRTEIILGLIPKLSKHFIT